MKLDPHIKIERRVIFGEGRSQKKSKIKRSKLTTPSSSARHPSFKTPAVKREEGSAATAPLNIILLGDPAAGKATHGAFLAKKYKLYDLDMGRELRKLEHNPVLRKKYKLGKTLDSGKLTPTELVRKLLFDKIQATSSKKGILFNGTPKMVGEARLVSQWLKAEKRANVIFVYLSIPHSEIVKRMTARKEYFKGKFSKRPDDNNKALKNRLAYYKKNITEVMKFFKKQYPYYNISTMGTIPEARKRILKTLTRY